QRNVQPPPGQSNSHCAAPLHVKMHSLPSPAHPNLHAEGAVQVHGWSRVHSLGSSSEHADDAAATNATRTTNDVETNVRINLVPLRFRLLLLPATALAIDDAHRDTFEVEVLAQLIDDEALIGKVNRLGRARDDDERRRRRLGLRDVEEAR